MPIPVLPILERLIQCGRDPNVPCPTLASRAWPMTRGHWSEVPELIGIDRVPDLIRGMVRYAVANHDMLDGSASPVIVLYYRVVKDLPEAEPDLTAWVVDHRLNPYEPFGAWCGCSRTYADWRARQSEAREAEDAIIERKVVRQSRNLADAVRRGDVLAVRGLLCQRADPKRALPDGGSLVALALELGKTAVADELRRMGCS